LEVSEGLWLEELGLGLGLWQGSYEGVEGLWLRFYDAEDNWIPTPSEQAEQERQRAEQERQRAEQERQRADNAEATVQQLRVRLQQLGIDPDSI
ncbi:Uma2 family endonuclease, partial [Spirulina sp. CS-785/01]|nr:Uma2 family endonuclease [Spirulina sp. CS-785/01]